MKQSSTSLKQTPTQKQKRIIDHSRQLVDDNAFAALFRGYNNKNRNNKKRSRQEMENNKNRNTQYPHTVNDKRRKRHKSRHPSQSMSQSLPPRQLIQPSPPPYDPNDPFSVQYPANFNRRVKFILFSL